MGFWEVYLGAKCTCPLMLNVLILEILIDSALLIRMTEYIFLDIQSQAGGWVKA